MNEAWPPDYSKEFMLRQERLQNILKNGMQAEAKAYYAENPIEFIEHWCCTYDPRNAQKDLPTTMPFILFKRQRELVQFVHQCVIDGESGLLEKARDMGATWTFSAYSVWLWLFRPGASIGWGSRKEMYVDAIGSKNSIFEKIRDIVRLLPRFFWPEGFDPKAHMPFMRIINPENGSTITGEAGDNIGRGGRSTVYFKDEAQPVDADILTPNGWVKMGEIKVGDLVIGKSGAPTKVIGIREFKKMPIYRLNFHDGTWAESTENHLWEVNKVHGKRETKTLRLAEFGDITYKSPGGQTQFRYRIDPCKPIEFSNRAEVLPLHPYILGVLLGDGSVSQVPHNSAKLTCADAGIIDRFRQNMPEGCQLNLQKNKARGIEYCFGDIVSAPGKFSRSRARTAVLDSGIAGCTAEHKFIPNIYKFSSIEDRLELLRGLMDTDGSGAGGVASYHTCSPILAEDVKFLVRSLGGLVTHNIKPDKRGFKDMHVLHMALPNNQSPFHLSRKTGSLRLRKHPLSRTLVSVEPTRIQDARCISVDAGDGLYITNHFIVTHNCAWYDHPEAIEAALGDNTDVQIDLSSVHGTANPFYRRRQAGEVWEPGKEMPKGKTRVFILDWRDHPAKSPEWYMQRRLKAEQEGQLAEFKQEVDRDYTGAIENLLIPSEWVNAAVDAHQKLGLQIVGRIFAGQDVADEGGDKNAFAVRHGDALTYVEDWGEGDTLDTAARSLKLARKWEVHILSYDCIGVGAGVKAGFNKMDTTGILIKPWNAGARCLWPTNRVIKNDPNSPRNEDYFANLKAQAWWALRMRFFNTYKAVSTGTYDGKQEIIILPGNLKDLAKVKLELSQPTFVTNGRGQIIVDKKPNGAKSPNLADAIVMAFFPLETPFFA